MNATIKELLNKYNHNTAEEAKAILREIVQSIVLVGLSRGGFFNKASFYGGTALRIFYGLNRYSEDLDFTLNEKDDSFTLEPYLKNVKEIALSYGLDLDVSIKNKSINTPIESAFAKLNKFQTFITLKLGSKLSERLRKDEVIKVKFEVDCNPVLGFSKESRWLDMPEFATISVLDEASLFSGKIHAILCRSYKNNVKGRDYYDFLFYVSKRIQPNIQYLQNKLIESGKITDKDEFNIEILKKMLFEKFNTVDFKQVREDAQKFLFKNEDLSFYSKELFLDMLKRM